MMKTRIKILTLLLIWLILWNCTTRESTAPPPSAPRLNLLVSYDLSVPEPSGLSLGAKGQSLWMVSDQTNRVYHLDLTGKILQTLSYVGTDLEGIAYDSLRNCLWVVEEQTRELVKLDFGGAELARHRILNGQDNSGLEGVCLDGQGTLFVLKEKLPGLFIKLSQDFSIEKQVTLDFARDYSGLCCDTAVGRFWVVSDESRRIYLWDSQKGVQKQFDLSIPKAEGIARDFSRNRLYVVSDSEAKLYIFAGPS